MPRPRKSVLRSTDEMLNQVELAGGVAPPSDVLMLCKLYRAAEKTILAQKEVILEHARTISGLKKRNPK